MKTTLKILLVSIVYLVLMSLVSAILPYSSNFSELAGTQRSLEPLLFLWLIGLWNAVFIYLVAKYSAFGRAGTWLLTLSYLFLLQSFMTQIETLFFMGSFPALHATDVIMIMASSLPALMASVWTGLALFRQEQVPSEMTASISSFVPKLLLISILYLIIYMSFGYFVAWQFDAVRLHYSGSLEKETFLQMLAINAKETPWIYPFQVMRGLFFGGINYLLYLLLGARKKMYVFASAFSNVALGLMLLVPNPLFAKGTRMGHFIEITTSMILFSLLMCWIFLWKNNQSEKTT